MEKGKPQIEIVFDLDNELLLTITASEKTTGKSLKNTTSGAPKGLTKEKISELLMDAENSREADQRKIKEIETKQKAERVINRVEHHLNESPTTPQRADLEKHLASLGMALESDDAGKISLESQLLEQLLPSPPRDPFDIFQEVFVKQASGRFQAPRGTSASARKTHQARTPSAQKNVEPEALDRAKTLSKTIGKIFGGTSYTPDPNLCFVLMPFAGIFQPIYDDYIRPVVQRQKMNCVRADEIVGVGSITKDIWENICRARFVVADLTGKNPNVFYEVGLAHALGKDVVLLTQTLDDVPFDLRNLRCLVYENTPRGMPIMMQKFEQLLIELIRSV